MSSRFEHSGAKAGVNDAMSGGAEHADGPLTGCRVAFTGRLASMTRSAAAELVRKHGGTFVRSVTRSTDLLVVGAAGWPLQWDGRPTRKLARTEALMRQGATLVVMAEESFLERIGVVSHDVLGLHPLPSVARSVGAPIQQLEALVRSGLVSPVKSDHGVALFDFRQVAAARSFCRLVESGVSPRTLVRSLARLQSWLPIEFAYEAMSRLSVVANAIALRTTDGRWLEPTGQVLIDFEGDDAVAETSVPLASVVAGDLFVEALDCEAAGDFQGAAALYRRLLFEEGPDADVCFNLGNVLYELKQTSAAAERFRRAAELDPDRADSWLNLGHALVELGELEDACDAYSLAVVGDSNYADARSALADALEQCGRYDEAVPHWRAYLDLEPHGPWSEYARRQLTERPAS